MKIEVEGRNPVVEIVNLPRGVDPRDPEVAGIINLAMRELADCDDTMALLVQRLGLAGDTPYKQIRSNFAHGRS